MNRTLRVFLACAMGAFIGGAVALELSGISQLMGIVVGGLLGYFGYNFRQSASAISHAWNKVKSQEFKDGLNTEGCKALSKLVGTMFATALSGFVVSAAIFGTIIHFRVQENWYVVPIELFGVYGLTLAVVGFAFGLLYAHELLEHVVIKTEIGPRRFEHVVEARRVFYDLNSFVVLWRAVKCLAFVVRFTLLTLVPAIFSKRSVWLGMKVGILVKNFTVQYFRIIHSDERLLCMVDAAIGAGVGLYFGNAVVGAIAGGCLGVVNYELVSKWWLKIAPAQK